MVKAQCMKVRQYNLKCCLALYRGMLIALQVSKEMEPWPGIFTNVAFDLVR